MSDTIKAVVLDRDQRDTLQQCEKIIAAAIDAFWHAGKALKTIRDNRLYREAYDSFEDYCRDRWALSRSQGYNLITHYETIEITELPTDMSTRAVGAMRKVKAPPQQVIERAVELTGKEAKDLTEHDIFDADTNLIERGEVEAEPPTVIRTDVGTQRSEMIRMASDLRSMYTELLGVRARLCTLAAEKQGWCNEAAARQVVTAAMSLCRDWAPFALCGACEGAGCPQCVHSGYVNKSRHFTLPEDERGMEL